MAKGTNIGGEERKGAKKDRRSRKTVCFQRERKRERERERGGGGGGRQREAKR